MGYIEIYGACKNCFTKYGPSFDNYPLDVPVRELNNRLNSVVVIKPGV